MHSLKSLRMSVPNLSSRELALVHHVEYASMDMDAEAET